MQTLHAVTLLVRDYDEAIEYYQAALQFEVLEDAILDKRKRWVRIAPRGSQGCSLLLAQPGNTEQAQHIGQQSGGRVFFFLHTDDFYRDYNRLKSINTSFESEPREEDYGTVVVFKDLYGNRWDLIQPKPQQ